MFYNGARTGMVYCPTNSRESVVGRCLINCCPQGTTTNGDRPIFGVH
jgi:hypothetical protein